RDRRRTYEAVQDRHARSCHSGSAPGRRELTSAAFPTFHSASPSLHPGARYHDPGSYSQGQRQIGRVSPLAWFLNPRGFTTTSIIWISVGAPSVCSASPEDRRGDMFDRNLGSFRTAILLLDDEGPEQSIPLPTADEEKAMSTSDVPETLPILALRNTVLFPGVVLPITVGRDASLKLVKDAFNDDRLIGVVAQKSSDVENPAPEDLFECGTVATILKLIKMPDGSKSIVIQGKRRFKIEEYVQVEPYLEARVTPIEEDTAIDDVQLQARIRSIKELAIQIVNLSPNLPSEAAYAIQNIDSPAFLIHFIASNLQIDVEDKQDLLETRAVVDRAEKVTAALNRELQVLQLSEEIRTNVKSDVDKQQREYLLRQQMKAIQDELGEGE